MNICQETYLHAKKQEKNQLKPEGKQQQDSHRLNEFKKAW
jgi:hypothetical protein